MKTFKNLVSEGKTNSDEITKQMLRSANPDMVNAVRDRYYGISDNMVELVVELNRLNGETGEFGNDLILAKKMLKLFDKMTLGKFL